MKTKNHYFLLRHGQTIYQARYKNTIYPKEANFRLLITKKGESQIKKAAKILKKKNISAIYSSDFKRTRQSAGIVDKELKLSVKFDKRLRDLDFGRYWGSNKKDYEKLFSNRAEKFTKRTPGGENWNDVIKRVGAVVKEIEKKRKGKNILIISHGDPLWLLYGIIKGFNQKDFLDEAINGNHYQDVGELKEIKYGT